LDQPKEKGPDVGPESGNSLFRPTPMAGLVVPVNPVTASHRA
jgi:hypothetical protein